MRGNFTNSVRPVGMGGARVRRRMAQMFDEIGALVRTPN